MTTNNLKNCVYDSCCCLERCVCVLRSKVEETIEKLHARFQKHQFAYSFSTFNVTLLET